ncbi:right-handed parallel beta-helix repeat-containing protein [uncultured Dysgonomonas sp.]|uniref:Right handed beta helix domain-containing protein n=1 Tax=uncultured Dysgonomonas sp. TaxID=206096 RepID=A0A212K596_9BACT|nr:right-handed parallel beta-helix repeat-containing protein [uncultured Dysgonomonas sp.]SBW06822.1 exported hypothetical protein [uncultured Dysgonomonas sp.]
MQIKYILSIMTCLLLMSGSCDGNNDNEDITVPIPNNGEPTTYYISSSIGADTNPGTSAAPWRTLDKINQVTFNPGDKILLKSGDSWNGPITISSKFTGTEILPIVISSYGEGNKPNIKASTGTAILTINNSDYLQVENIDIGNGPGYGLIFGVTDNKKHGNIKVKNVHVHDVPIAGIFFNDGKFNNYNIDIVSCTADNVEMLFAISSGENVNISDCVANNCIYGGFSIISVKGGTIDNCKVLNCGTGNYPNGACGIFLGINDGFVISNTEIAYQKRQADNPDAEAIDFERDNKNVTVKNCYMHDNDGCAIMFFDNMKGLVNEDCIIEDCVFENNSLNASSPRGFEISFSRLDCNNNGTIRNNTFKLNPGIQFITTVDPSVTVTGNKNDKGEPLELAYEAGILIFNNAGFEVPALAEEYQYQPSGGYWTFRKNSGISVNGGAFNPPAIKEGKQIAFLQGDGEISNYIYLSAGSYKLSFSAAYRNSSGIGQGVAIYINNNKIGGDISLTSGTNFENYESDSFSVETGINLIEIRGTYTGDKTAFLDNINVKKLP